MNWDTFAAGFAISVLIVIMMLLGFAIREAARAADHRRNLATLDHAHKLDLERHKYTGRP